MGVKFGREYEDILEDLQKGLAEIDDIHLFLGMLKEEWVTLSKKEQQDCLVTVADDIFYGLGEDPTLSVGQGTITYNPIQHIITVQHYREIIIPLVDSK